MDQAELWAELCELAIEPGLMRHQFDGETVRLRRVMLANCQPCGKRLYRTRRKARRSRKFRRMHVYRCPHRIGWHLTTIPARRLAWFKDREHYLAENSAWNERNTEETI